MLRTGKTEVQVWKFIVRQSAKKNLRAYVREAKSHMALLGTTKDGVLMNDWKSKYWNIFDGLQNKTGTNARRTYLLWFTTSTTKKRGTLADRAKKLQAFAPSFDDFAKAYVIHHFIQNPTTDYGSIFRSVRSLRMLYAKLVARSTSPCDLCMDDFLEVENDLIKRWELPDQDQDHIAHATARGSAENLQSVGTILDAAGLISVRIGYKTRIPLQRTEIIDRQREPFRKRRKRLLPEPEVFYFLADLSNQTELDPNWRIRLRPIELQIALGRRITEMLTLPVDCLVRDSSGAVIGVRYLPRKNAEPYVAWVPKDKHFDVASKMVERAVEDARILCEPARRMAAILEACDTPDSIPLPGYAPLPWRAEIEFAGLDPTDSSEWMLAAEFGQVFGVPSIHFTPFLKAHGIKYLNRVKVRPNLSILGNRAPRMGNDGIPLGPDRDRVMDLLMEWQCGLHGKWLNWAHVSWQTGCSSAETRMDAGIRKIYWQVSGELAKRWPEYQPSVTGVAMARIVDVKKYIFNEWMRNRIVIEQGTQQELLLSQALFVVFKFQFASNRTTRPIIVEPLRIHHIQVFLRGAKTLESVFEKFGRPDLSAKSHGFRRWVTTEGRRAGINNLVLARWLGRSAVQNDVYDYNEPTVFEPPTRQVYKDIEKVFGPVKDIAQDMETRGVPLVEREAFLSAELNGIITTEKGGCSHEWAVTPCQKGRACYNNCNEYYVIKGRQDHYETALKEKPKIERALELSKAQVGAAYYANGYVQLCERQLVTLKEVIRIHEDTSIADGTLIQVNPGGSIPSPRNSG